MAFFFGIVLGFAVGWARGGSVLRLADVRWHGLIFLLVGPVLQQVLPWLWPGIAHHPPLEIGRAVLLYGGGLGFLWANRRLPGAWWVFAGTCGNALATFAAGGRMPVALWALYRFPAVALARMRAGGFGAHAPMLHPSGLTWLGDIIPSPPPLPPEVMSVGDIAIGFGLAVFLWSGMRETAATPQVS